MSKCVQLLIESGYAPSLNSLLPQVYSQLLFNPIATWGESSLPSIRHERGRIAKNSASTATALSAPVVVEVQDFANIGASQAEQSKGSSTEEKSTEQGNSENVSLGAANLRRMLKMIVSDGQENIVALE
jgi:hypothetical protein